VLHGSPVARRLAAARRENAREHVLARFAAPARAQHVAPGHGRDCDVQIDPVEQGSGDLGAVARDLGLETAALARRRAAPAARTRVHRGDELKARGQTHAAVRARDPDLALFERLAQRLEHRPPELGQLVEEQASAVCGGSRPVGRPAATRHARVRRAVVAATPVDRNKPARPSPTALWMRVASADVE
jgi:hypothetical protein